MSLHLISATVIPNISDSYTLSDNFIHILVFPYYKKIINLPVFDPDFGEKLNNSGIFTSLFTS
jgi:hypothetical protein